MTQLTTVPLMNQLFTAVKILQVRARPVQKSLIDLLSAPDQAPVGPSQALAPSPLSNAVARFQEPVQTFVTEVSQALSALDARYQQVVQRYVDPLLIDRTRSEQLAVLAAGRERKPSAHEQEVNRHIAIGIGAVATVGLAHLTALPLAPLVIATGFYLTIPLLRICWQIGVKERRLSVAHLLAA